MEVLVTEAVSDALPAHEGHDSVDLLDLHTELESVAFEALRALEEGFPLDEAVVDPRFAALGQFHRDLRDSLFVELPRELRGWVEQGVSDASTAEALSFVDALAHLARQASTAESSTAPLQRALAELLVFEGVRLRLLLTVWRNEDFERFGGEESDIDAIAWQEVERLIDDPALDDDQIRPGTLIFAAAQVSVVRQLAQRADALKSCHDETREHLTMRARLLGALRQLRLPESVLLGNALSSLLNEPRLELADLQQAHPVALDGLSRQAMDQRVCRGRRALTSPQQHWPRRRQAALIDLLDPAS